MDSSKTAERIRSSADRAYYAAFLYARDQLTAKGYIAPYYSNEDHKYVTTNLRLVLGNLGNDENRLRSLRNRLTYDTRELVDSPVSWAIHTAKTIIESVKALPHKDSFLSR